MPVIGHLSASKPRSAGLSGVLKPQSKVHLARRFRGLGWTSDTENACDNRLFEVTVPQAVEVIAVFNHSKKCFLCSGDFQRRSYIFCAAVVNGKASWPFENRTAVTKEASPPATQKLRRHRQRYGGAAQIEQMITF